MKSFLKILIIPLFCGTSSMSYASTNADIDLFIADGNLPAVLEISDCPYLQTVQDPNGPMGTVECRLGRLLPAQQRRTGNWIQTAGFGQFISYSSVPNSSGLAPCGITYNLCQYLTPIGFPFFVQAITRTGGVGYHSDVYIVTSCETGNPQ